MAAYPDQAGVEQIQRGGLCPLLDNLALIGIVAAQDLRCQLSEQASDALFRIYESMSNYNPNAPFPTFWTWREVMKRLYTVGAGLMAFRAYQVVPAYIRKAVTWRDSYSRRFWVRHFAASGALRVPPRPSYRNMCDFAEAFVQSQDWFYELFGRDLGRLCSGLAQFDFVQCVHSLDFGNSTNAAYPSFAIWDSWRVEQLLSEIINDGAVRGALLPQISDERLAEIVRILERKADDEAFSEATWAGGFTGTVVQRFLERHRRTNAITDS